LTMSSMVTVVPSVTLLASRLLELRILALPS